MQKLWLLVVPFLFLHAKPSFSQSLAYSRNARTFETVNSSLLQKSLSHACLAMLESPDSLPCNPSLTPRLKKPKFGVDLLLSNGYSNLNSVRKLIKGDVNEDLMDELFEENRIIQIEADSRIDFLSPNFNARYRPMSVMGFSVVRNEANPDVELLVMEESGFHFQSGYELTKNFYIGAQVRFVERKFIKNRFRLVDLGTPSGSDILKSKSQKASYFEPAFTYMSGGKWNPRFSFLMANLGFEDKEYDEVPVEPDPQVGLGISPPIAWGSLDLMLDYKSLTYLESFEEKLHFGVLYRFGAMNLSGGLDAHGMSAGVYYSIEQVNAGVMYSTTQVANQDEEFFTQAVYVQFGWQI